MAKLPALILTLLAATAAAAERGELPLTVLTGGISKEPRPALAVGAFAGGFGIRDQPDRTLARWLPQIRRYDISVSAVFGELAPPRAGGPLLVIAALPMPWRPSAIERDGATITVRGDAVEVDAATPAMTSEPAEALRLTHDFALMVPRDGVESIALSVMRHGGRDERGLLTTATSFEHTVRVGATGAVDARTPPPRTRERTKDDYGWAVPRAVVLEAAGGDHEEGVAGVGTVDLKTESKLRPPPVRDADWGAEYEAELVTPVLQSGEWAQVRTVEWIAGACHIGVALFQDNGGRDSNVPHRDALVVPLGTIVPAVAGSGPQAPQVEVHWQRLIAPQIGGIYVPQHDPANHVRDAAVPTVPAPKPHGDF